MATRADVAALAKVSLTTVSHVLGNTPHARVHKETRKRVLNAAKELNYRPNIFGQALVKKKINHLGVTVLNHEITDSIYFSEILRGIRNEAENFKYHVLLCPSDNRRSTEIANKLMNIISERRVDGFIIDKEDTLTTEAERMLLNPEKYPLVFINCSKQINRQLEKYQNFYSIGIDHRQGVNEAMEYFLNSGHSRIALLSRPYNSIPDGYRRGSDTERLKSYCSTLKMRGIEFDENLFVEGDLKDDGKTRDAVKALMSLAAPPTAILAADDTLALSAISTLHDLGKSVPRDVAIIGYNNLPFGAKTIPALSTVSVPLLEMGISAVKILMQLIEGENISSKITLLKPKLIIRKSC